MVLIYLSDKSVEVVKKNDPPETGRWLGKKWLPVLRDVCQWRVISFPNQLALRTNINDIRELDRHMGHLKGNSPTYTFVNNVLVSLKNEIGNVEIVEVPVDGEGEEEAAVAAGIADAALEVADAAAEKAVAAALDEEE